MSLTRLATLFQDYGITRDTEITRACCGLVIRLGDPDPEGTTTRRCRNYCCTEVLCPCGAVDFSVGPAGCRCSWSNRPRVWGPNPAPTWRFRRGKRKY